MNLLNGDDAGVRRRGFLRLSGGLLATATVGATGCLDGGEAEIEYRKWIPSTFDPTMMYVDVNVLSEHHSMWEAGGGTQYELTFDDIAEIVGTSGAEILILEEDASPQISDDEGTAWDSYQGYTIHESSAIRDSEVEGFVASDGEVVIEAQTQEAIESVIDARAGDTTRLHEEDGLFEGLTTKVGEGDIVSVPEVNGRSVRRREARAADVSEGTSDIRIAVEADEEEFDDIDEGSNARYVTIEEVTERDAEAGIVLLDGTVETERIPEAFGLVAEGSGSSDASDESGGESGSMSESESESQTE